MIHLPHIFRRRRGFMGPLRGSLGPLNASRNIFTPMAVVASGAVIGGYSFASINIGNTSGANLIVVAYSWKHTYAEPSIADTYGNTWTTIGSVATCVDMDCRLAYAASATVGANHVIQTQTLSGLRPSLAILAISGAAASPLDKNSGAVNSFGSGSLAPGSITPTEANEIAVTAFTCQSLTGATPTAPTGYTMPSYAFSSASQYPIAIAYLVQTTAAATNPSWNYTPTSSNYKEALIASFKHS